ncbi:hypothetical protein SLEP1_g6001 [Rubroshorea leprosula]|uniref:Uncharacterized protein n=1 Tax=Rubroshorea leprosula TaxID=152421 RepID=A0AAV5I2V8_9ROSI|nr:hypothetical protein SLEP1_g6001 [Rubroshorea leprosula]
MHPLLGLNILIEICTITMKQKLCSVTDDSPSSSSPPATTSIVSSRLLTETHFAFMELFISINPVTVCPSQSLSAHEIHHSSYRDREILR